MARNGVVRRILIAASLAFATAASMVSARADTGNYLPGVNVQGGNARVGAGLAPGGGVRPGPVQPLQTPGGGGVARPRVNPPTHGFYPTVCTPMRSAAGQCRPGRL
jgi:hypothetical protein